MEARAFFVGWDMAESGDGIWYRLEHIRFKIASEIVRKGFSGRSILLVPQQNE